MDKISIDLVLTQVQDESRPVSTVTRLAIRWLLVELKDRRASTMTRSEVQDLALKAFLELKALREHTSQE